jgi:hypothetical protein
MRPSRQLAIFVILAICAQSTNAVSEETVLFTKNLADGRKIEVSSHEIPVPPPTPVTAEEREWDQKHGATLYSPERSWLKSFNIVSPDGRQTNSIWSKKTYVYRERESPWGHAFEVIDAAATSNEFILVYREGSIFANVITTTPSGEHVSMPAQRAELLSADHHPIGNEITSVRIEGTLRDKNLTVLLFWEDTEAHRFRLTETATGKLWVEVPRIPSKGSGD